MLCESSCVKKETWLSTRLFNSARFMKVLKGTARKSQISRKLMQSDNRPALPQSVTKHACTVEVVMHRRRNSAQHLPKVFFVHENASFRQSLQVNTATPRERKCQHCWPWRSRYAPRGCRYSCHHTMLQEDADIHVITLCSKRMPIFMSSHRQRSEMKFTARRESTLTKLGWK